MYQSVKILDDLVYEWVSFFKCQVYERGRFRNTGSHTRTKIIPKLPAPPLPEPLPHPPIPQVLTEDLAFSSFSRKIDGKVAAYDWYLGLMLNAPEYSPFEPKSSI